MDHCPHCGGDLTAPAAPPTPPPPSDLPVSYRWLEASLGCPDCLEAVEVLTSAAQGEEDHDDHVYVHAGDVWRCADGHLGSVVVAAALGGAYLAEPVLQGQSREDAEATARPLGGFVLRAPLRRGAA